MNRLFAFEDVEAALAFQHGLWASRWIYQVEPVEAEVPFRGNFNLSSEHAPEIAWADFLPRKARRYWTKPPLAQSKLSQATALASLRSQEGAARLSRRATHEPPYRLAKGPDP